MNEVEREITAADPAFAAYLHDGQRRLARTASSASPLVDVFLLLLIVFLLVLS